jgi:hypothetical protein
MFAGAPLFAVCAVVLDRRGQTPLEKQVGGRTGAKPAKTTTTFTVPGVPGDLETTKKGARRRGGWS